MRQFAHSSMAAVDTPPAWGAVRPTRRAVMAAAAAAVALGLAGMRPSRATATVRVYQDEGAAARALVPEASGTLLEIYPAGALHVVGQDRFALGVIDGETGPIENAQIELLFLKLVNNQGTLTEKLPAPFFPYGAAERHMAMGEADHEAQDVTGVYIAQPTFDAPGPWGVVVRATLPDGSVRAGQADFPVVAETDVPGPGDPAIASTTPVATAPEAIARICTADPVDDMHGVALDAALRNGKPTVLLFATPALCTSRVCGPSLEAMEELKTRYGGDANFLHVEIYPERDYTKPAPAVEAWHLPSEPWLFLIDGAGTVVARYEGGIGLTELDPAVRQLVGAA